jgi:VIT1/CCC1 family predicted Fe2+/Mn2+ transporter
VRLAGLAGLVAGAVSMAAGEWISVTAQVELFKGVLGDLRRLEKEQRTLLIGQLEKRFTETGIAPETARAAAQEVGTDDSRLFHVSAQRLVGGVVARSSGRSIAYGAVRQLLIILLAAVVTYYAGVLFGT